MTLLTELQRRNVIRVGVPSSEFISSELSHAARKGEEAAVLVAVARRRIRSADVVEGRVWRAPGAAVVGIVELYEEDFVSRHVREIPRAVLGVVVEVVAATMSSLPSIGANSAHRLRAARRHRPWYCWLLPRIVFSNSLCHSRTVAEGRRRTEEWPESPADATAAPSEPPKRRSLRPQMNAADRSSRHQDPKREPLRTDTQSRRGAAE